MTGIYAENGQGRKTPWVYTDPKTGERIFTHGSHPKPYMRPGYRSQKENIKRLLEQYLGELGVTANISIKKVSSK